MWCRRSDGGAARAASSPSVERPTSVRMSVRMVTRFVYVRVGGDLLEVPKLRGALFGFARACGGAAEVPRGGVVVHAALRLASAACTGRTESLLRP